MAAIIALVALLPAAAVFSHRALAPMILIMGLLVGLRGEPWRKGVPYFLLRPDFRDPVIAGSYALLAFCVWIAVTALRSPLHEKWELSVNTFFPAFAGGAVAWEILRRPAAQTALLASIFAAAVALAALVLLTEGLTGAPLRAIIPPEDLSPQRFKDFTALGRGVTAITPMVFPAAAIAYQKTGRRLAPAGIAALALAAAASLSIEANIAALLAGGLAALLAFSNPRRALAAMTWLIAAALVFAPFAAAAIPADWAADRLAGAAPTSWLQRLFIWKEAGRAAIEALPFGRGADYARAWSDLGAMIEIPSAAIPLPAMPTHPHNIFLQIWLELGLPGVIAFGAVLLAGARALAAVKWTPVVAAGAMGAIAVVFVSALVEASLWQVWRISAMALAVLGVTLSYSAHQKTRSKIDGRGEMK